MRIYFAGVFSAIIAGGIIWALIGVMHNDSAAIADTEPAKEAFKPVVTAEFIPAPTEQPTVSPAELYPAAEGFLILVNWDTPFLTKDLMILWFWMKCLGMKCVWSTAKEV